jgi:transcriptional regulator with XRE-family HTH domain
MSKLSTHKSNIEIGKRILAVRAASGLSQNDFAESLEMSPRAYANYERGEREMPVALFKGLYESYSIDPVWLLTGPGEQPIKVTERRVDGDLLEILIRMIEEWLTKNRRMLKPEKKARLIRLAYEHCSEHGEVDSAHLKDMLSLAA